MSRRTSILCVASHNSPHITPFYDELAVQENVDVTRASLHRLPAWRLEMGWPEMEADAPYLQPWRSWEDRRAYHRALMSLDIAILPAFFHTKTEPFHHLARRLTGRPTLLWNEYDLGRRHRSFLNYWAKSVLLFPCDTTQFHLLSMGLATPGEFRRLGVRKWRAWLFSYAVQPMFGTNANRIEKNSDELHIVFCGSLTQRKGVDFLVEALGRPELAKKPWRLMLIGDGEQRAELENAAARLGIRDKMSFLGILPRHRCAEIYAAGDVLVLPSRYDGWGAVINEAMDFGLAVIASDAAGASMMVSHGENGFVFSNGNSEELSGYLARLVADPSLAAKMGRASLEQIRMYHPDQLARRLAALCRGIAGHAPMPSFKEGICSSLPWPA